MSELKEFQQRVVDEKKELDEKIEKLRAFFDTDIYKVLDTGEQNRLRFQIHYMERYSEVLGERIENFKRSNNLLPKGEVVEDIR